MEHNPNAHAKTRQWHTFYDSLIIVNSVLVYIMEPNAVSIHRSFPDSVKGLVNRHQSFGTGTRCNLEMSHAYRTLWVVP